MVVLVAVGAVALVVSSRQQFRVDTTRPDPPDGTQTIKVDTKSHTDQAVAYAQTPPVGGDHAPAWQNCGFYDAPIASENAVHSLEHGAVWITYSAKLPASDVERLKQVATSTSYVLVSKWGADDLPAPVVASALGHQPKLQSACYVRTESLIDALRLDP